MNLRDTRVYAHLVTRPCKRVDIMLSPERLVQPRVKRSASELLCILPPLSLSLSLSL